MCKVAKDCLALHSALHASAKLLSQEEWAQVTDLHRRLLEALNGPPEKTVLEQEANAVKLIALFVTLRAGLEETAPLYQASETIH